MRININTQTFHSFLNYLIERIGKITVNKNSDCFLCPKIIFHFVYYKKLQTQLLDDLLKWQNFTTVKRMSTFISSLHLQI